MSCSKHNELQLLEDILNNKQKLFDTDTDLNINTIYKYSIDNHNPLIFVLKMINGIYLIKLYHILVIKLNGKINLYI